MRLIDADALENVEIPVNGYWDESRQCYVYQPPTWMQAFEAINKAPTIDAVPVVRCRECRYVEPTRNTKRKNKLPLFCTIHRENFKDGDEFCCFGQRREDGDGDG